MKGFKKMKKLPYDFCSVNVTKEIVEWIRRWFKDNGDGCKAVVGISGGKDSAVVAALCERALGRERVFGVLMPNGEQSDIDMSKLVVKHLNINHSEINIGSTVDNLTVEICRDMNVYAVSRQASINLPARIRMATLYAVSQSVNGRVANTCNLSEDWVGYATRYGDGAGDFAPLANLTVGEVINVGYELGVPECILKKVPSDGLCGLTDEQNLGFSYDVLDRYIRTGKIPNDGLKMIIDDMHDRNLFKMQLMQSFPYDGEK